MNFSSPQINLTREYLPNRGQADALAHMVDVALLGFFPIQPAFQLPFPNFGGKGIGRKV